MSRYSNCLNRTLTVLVLLVLGGQSWASVPGGISEYYIPVDEDNDWTILNALGGIDAGENMHSVISLTPWGDNTTIYVDHWEDGYDFDANNPTTADETCTANAGDIKTFESDVPLPRTSGLIPGQGAYVGSAGNCTGQASPGACTIGSGGNTDYCYDGRDRIVVVGSGSTMVRGGWPQTTGVVTGIAEEVYPVTPQLTTYILPFGEDLYAANPTRTDYRRVFVTIQSTESTTFQVDFNHDGIFDAIDCNYDDTTDGTQCSLNAGEIYNLSQTSDGNGNPFPTLNSGAIIKGGATLQVQYINGDSAATYNSRATSAFPRGFWDDEYYAPAPSSAAGNGDTDILLYNPNSTAISIEWETRTTSGSFTLDAYESAFFQEKRAANGCTPAASCYVPSDSGVYLKGSKVFWGVSDIDVNSSARDWAYSLVPAYLLDKEQFLSWAPGCYATSGGTAACAGTVGNRDDNGVFIVPAQDNTTVFVDRNNDGTADYTYNLDRLQVQYVYDATDGDLTGAHIWATGPYVLSYGENLDTSDFASPSLDAGYTTLPNPGNWMDLALTVKKSANPVVLSTTANPATTTYSLTVQSHEFDIDNVTVTDNLAYDWTYAAGTDSTTITLPNGSTLTTDPSVTAPGGALPGGGTCSAVRGSCLTWPGATLGSMAPNQTITIVFTARTNGTPDCSAGTPCLNGSLSKNEVKATATRTVGSITQTFTATDFAYNAYMNNTVGMTVTKTSGAADPVSPGDTIPYTVTVSNPGTSTANLTGVALFDLLPAGTSYAAGSGSITCGLAQNYQNYRDQFATAAYNNTNGSVDWSSNSWTETDGANGGSSGVGGGFVWINGGQLQFRYLQSRVYDQFNTNGSYTGNDGSYNWNGAWTETSDDNSASSGRIRVTNNWIRFRPGAAGRSVSRTATVTNAGSATINFSLTDSSMVNGETIVAEYQLDGGAWVNIGTLDGNTGNFSATLPFAVPLASNNTLTIRFTAPEAWSATHEGRLDNVQIATQASGAQIQRTANLGGAASATLNFSYSSAGLAGGDTAVVEASSSASGPFTTLATFTAGTPSPAPSYNLTPYISANTTVRFRVTGGYAAAGKSLNIDNVDISYSSGAITFASANPPNFLATGTGCLIPPGQNLTLTFNATVDNPLPSGISEILNTAYATANEIPIPISDDARNIVVNPTQNSATVGDRVWLDSDGDGILDLGESGLANVEVTLKDQYGTPLQTATTDSQGRYRFNGVASGIDYYVEATAGLPSGLTQTLGSSNRSVAFDLVAGQTYNDADLGYKPASGNALIGDRVWSDADGDGMQDAGEPGLSGINVRLYTDSNGNGEVDVGETYVETATGVNGSYSFTAAASGTQDYIVYVDIAQAALTAYNLTTGNGFVFYDVAGGGSYPTADFGVQQKTAGTTFTMTDRVWLDDGNGGGTPGDGLQNGGEIGLSGVTVDLLDASGNVIATTMTDASGNFSFTGVPGGVRYGWRVTDLSNVLANYYGTTPSAQTNDYQMPGTLTADTSYTAAPHFGYNIARSIGDTLFNDLDGNGLQNGSEAGISGVSVKLYTDAGTLGIIDGGDAVVATLTTDANGKYLFSGLANGDYIVSIETPPSGYNYCTGNDVPSGVGCTGAGQPADSDNGTAGQQRAANIAGGGSDLDNDFGYHASVSYNVSGRVWNDANNNGADNSEAGLANVTVELYLDADGNGSIDAGETRSGVTNTDGSGNYSFVGMLSGGNYIVRITDQNGVLAGFSATYEKTEGTTAPFNGLESVLNLNSNVTDLNFGFFKPAPTYALISGFRVYTMNGQSWVEWSTLREQGTVGFFIERENPASGEWMRLNGGQMLRGLVVSAEGGDYRLADPEVSAGEIHRYRLVEHEAWGTERTYGPWRVKIAPQDAARMPQQMTAASSAAAPSVQAGAWKSLGQGYMARAHLGAKKPAQPAVAAGASARLGNISKLSAGSGALAAAQAQQVRLRTGAEGLYRLDAQNLTDIAAYWGVNDIFTALNQGAVNLETGAKTMPYYYDSDNKALYFVGAAYQTRETQENVYRFSAAPGKKMLVTKGTKGPGAAVPGVFRDIRRFEENSNKDYLLPWVHSEENADYWYWSYIMPPYVPAASLTLQLPEPSDSGRGILKIYLRGAADEAEGDDRLVTANLNGVPLPGSVRWSGNTEAVLQAEFDQAALGAVVNGTAEVKLQVSSTPLNGAAYDLSLIDRIEIEYDRKMRAYQGGVWMRGVAPGVVGVDGFGSDKISVIENPGTGAARLRKNVTVTATAAGDYQASFTVAKTAAYLVTETSAAAQVEADYASNLKAKKTASDYLIIAPRALSQGAAALADYRQQIFSTEIVWLDDIYDEFSYGRTNSVAIERFLNYVFKNRSRAPRYVVLLGRGTLDHRDLLGYRESLIPLRLAGTPWGLAASDNRYADVDGDKLPDYRLGRIVVSSDQEALAYVDKLIAYEAAVADAWNLRTTLVADNPDSAGDFHANSNHIGDLLQTYAQGYTVNKLYHPLINVRSNLLNGWNNGYGYVNYIGHGGATQLASEGFMTVADVANMTNGVKLPVFAALTCAVGDSTMPGVLGLSDKLVLSSAGGAIAAFSPTGLSIDNQALPLNRYFVERLLNNREDIGSAAMFAHQLSSTVDRIDGFMHDIYQVSGDPAVRLR